LDRVLLTTSSGVHIPQMPEYVLMMMLAWAHRLPALIANQAGGEWFDERRPSFTPDELRGATLGVVGYGTVGRESARLAKVFGMRILACKRDPRRRHDGGWCLPGTGDPAGDLPEHFYGLDELAVMLPECDYVLIALPLTAATRHLFGAQALRAMRSTAVLINIARGGVVDEPALIGALAAGTIRAAALDVFEQEPLPSTSPLWSMPNVLLSPHITGLAPGYDTRLMALFADNLRRYLGRQPLLNRVDSETGY
jgi:phosphoglycerate dehydrogenase-like enzyme